MSPDSMQKQFTSLANSIDGDVYTDNTQRLLYSVDASAYRKLPEAVVRPKNASDIKKIILFAAEHNIPVVPRAAGTSLAGQVVGGGIIMDTSKYMTGILEVNPEEKWVWVQPGVVLDELNLAMKEHGLFFGPETSTANRCMMGGMVGNNACGAHSIIYGSTRDHVLELKTLLADGSEAHFEPLSIEQFEEKCALDSLEGNVYRDLKEILSNPENQEEIRREYPAPALKRRNTGYAIDLMLRSEVFGGDEKFNFCKLLAGSEGTLAATTAIKLNLVPLPPKESAVICVHLDSLNAAFKANLIALKYNPGAVELIDKTIIELTKGNIDQAKNRFFIEGEPESILIAEFARDTKAEIEEIAEKLEQEMRSAGFGYHFPIIWGKDINRVWNLRKAGLGILSNMKGDAKPVPVVEDTAVDVNVLPDYMEEFQQILAKYKRDCVYFAHIGSGELHLRPILNLKDPADVELFHSIASDVAHLVKKYKGSLSGEHGDGRLRGEFIPVIIGKKNYELLRRLKNTWDPKGIFNPGKIVDTPRMNSDLRFRSDSKPKLPETIFDFSNTGTFLQAAEKCNGSGDCRKTEIIGGTMCPSFQATRDERNTTRARANLLREYLTNSDKVDPFTSSELYDILDLCLSCKACKSECPSNVDMAKLKAEFLHHYYKANGVPLRSKLFGNIHKIQSLAINVPRLYNSFQSNRIFGKLLKAAIGVAGERSMPSLAKQKLTKWADKNPEQLKPSGKKDGAVYLLADEFINYLDVEIGKKAVAVLTSLGYEVIIPGEFVTGRALLSKGFLEQARDLAEKNVQKLSSLATAETPLVGLEPSTTLTFRDEYPELVRPELRKDASKLAKVTLMLDEFLARLTDDGKIDSTLFHKDEKTVQLHGHCQQKAIASTSDTLKILSLPENYKVSEIPSGCCGMAGSFGFEKEHYELSMKVGELVLFPAVRKAPENTSFSAPGTSCRHQIADGTGKIAGHPAEILYDALLNKPF